MPPDEDMLRVILAADPDKQDYLWTIALTMGRMSEVNRLTWQDVNFEERHMVLYTCKKKAGIELQEKFPCRINNKKSLDRAELSVTHLRKEFENAKVPDITTPRIKRYVADRMKWTCKVCEREFHFNGETHCPKCGSETLKKGAKNATINRELSALRRMLNLGAKQTPPKVNRVPYIPMLKENNVRKGFFEHAQFIALRDALPGYLKPFVTFGYKVGWRDKEIASLNWSNVDLQNGIVTLKAGETKNDDARTVYLDDELKAMFQQQWENRKRNGKLIPFVFPNKGNAGMIINFRKAWNKACRESGPVMDIR